MERDEYLTLLLNYGNFQTAEQRDASYRRLIEIDAALRARVAVLEAERDEARGHSRDHHLEPCMTCLACTAERDAAWAIADAAVKAREEAERAPEEQYGALVHAYAAIVSLPIHDHLDSSISGGNDYVRREEVIRRFESLRQTASRALAARQTRSGG